MISIIIVNYNSAEYLGKCLVSIYDNLPSLAFEIIVVDNNSQTGDLDEVTSGFPDVLLIKCKNNLGFSKANNIGFYYSSGEFLLFLNPDIEVLAGSIETLIRVYRRLPSPGALGCHLFNADMSTQTSSIMKFPTVFLPLYNIDFLKEKSVFATIFRIRPLFERKSTIYKVDAISGACMFISRKAFYKVNGFNESFFLFSEDIDLCYNLKGLGFLSYYTPTSEMIHHGGKSTDTAINTNTILLKKDSELKYHTINKGRLHAFIFLQIVTITSIVRLLLLSILKFSSSEGIASSIFKWKVIFNWSIQNITKKFR